MLTFIILVVIVFAILKAIVNAIDQTIAQKRAARLQALEEIRQQAIAAQLQQERERHRQLVEEQRERQRQYMTQQAEVMLAERERQRAIAQARREEEEARKEAIRIEKELERAEKREFERAAAEADLEFYAEVRQGYLDLCEELEKELNASTTTEKRRATIQRQLLTLEEKLHRLDQKRAKAYYLAQRKGA